MKKVNDKIDTYNGSYAERYTVIEVVHKMGESDGDINLYIGVEKNGMVELVGENNSGNWVIGYYDGEENTAEWKRLVEVCGKGAVEYAINTLMKHNKSVSAWLRDKYQEAMEGKED